jgi:type II pantothenate kinase
MSHFCLLSDPDSYVATDWDLLADEEGRTYWLDHFRRQFEDTLKFASQQYGRAARGQINEAGREFAEAIGRLRGDPSALTGGKLNIIEIDRLRDGILRKHGLHDPFADLKARESDAAVALYPDVVRRLHAMDGEAKWLQMIKGLFAGNMFDLGADPPPPAASPADFFAVVERTKPRPWVVDDYEPLKADLLSAPPAKWAKAVVFADNAGIDFVLGVMPLARELAIYGTQIVLAANEKPSLNDITVDEAIDVVEQLAAADAELAAMIRAGMFEVASSGNDIPLIDLSDVSDELNEAGADADLVVLEGMGRAIESNADAVFSVDCLRLALLKSPPVAARLGGEMYDCVCKYTTVA